MKLVIQRAVAGRVTVDGRTVAGIGAGAVVLVGVAKGDTDFDARHLARKTSLLRVFDDEQGRLNCSIEAVKGAFLVVSQFTLYGDCAKGNRPSYIEAAEPAEAQRLYELYAAELRALGHEARTGVFGGRMLVAIENDGPVTILMESRGRQAP